MKTTPTGNKYSRSLFSKGANGPDDQWLHEELLGHKLDDEKLSKSFKTIGLPPKPTDQNGEYLPHPAQWTAMSKSMSRRALGPVNPSRHPRLVNGQGGHWVTTEDDHKLFISDGGKIIAGNPHVIAHIKEHHPEGKAELSPAGEGTWHNPNGLPDLNHDEKHNIQLHHEHEHDNTESGGHERPTERDPERSEGGGGHVETETEPAEDEGAHSGGESDGGPSDPPVAERIPAPIRRVNKNIDRMISKIGATLNPSHPKHNPANQEAVMWLHSLKHHVNNVGVDAALDSISDNKNEDHGYSAQLPQNERVGYITIQKFLSKDGADRVKFLTNYLDRHGIDINSGEGAFEKGPSGQKKTAIDKSTDIDIDSPTTGALPGHLVTRGEGPNDAFSPDTIAKNKLHEAQMIPGLEGSIALDKATKFTPKFHAAMDKRFGKDAWIVKRYDDSGVAGQGIYTPQRIRDLQKNAQKAIWNAGSALSKYGFSIDRDKKGKAIGLKHSSGDVYPFESKKYQDTIHGDARHWGDIAHKAADHENGVSLKDDEQGAYMAQAAYPVVGLSEEAKAKGFGLGREGLATFNKIAQETGEARTHIHTQAGSAYHIPSSTWMKGAPMPSVFDSPETKSIKEAAIKAVSALPEAARQGQTYGPDIIRTYKPGVDRAEADRVAKEKGFDPAYHEHKVIELNPVSGPSTSGYLLKNPMVIDSYVSHLQGRDPQHVKFIKQLLTQRKRQEEQEKEGSG